MKKKIISSLFLIFFIATFCSIQRPESERMRTNFIDTMSKLNEKSVIDANQLTQLETFLENQREELTKEYGPKVVGMLQEKLDFLQSIDRTTTVVNKPEITVKEKTEPAETTTENIPNNIDTNSVDSRKIVAEYLSKLKSSQKIDISLETQTDDFLEAKINTFLTEDMLLANLNEHFYVLTIAQERKSPQLKRFIEPLKSDISSILEAQIKALGTSSSLLLNSWRVEAGDLKRKADFLEDFLNLYRKDYDSGYTKKATQASIKQLETILKVVKSKTETILKNLDERRNQAVQEQEVPETTNTEPTDLSFDSEVTDTEQPTQDSSILKRLDGFSMMAQNMEGKSVSECITFLTHLFSIADPANYMRESNLKKYISSLEGKSTQDVQTKGLLKPLIDALYAAGKKDKLFSTQNEAELLLKTTLDATLNFKEKKYKGFWAKIGIPSMNRFTHVICLSLFKTVSTDRYSDLLKSAQSIKDIVEVMQHIQNNPQYNGLSLYEKNAIEVAKTQALKELLNSPSERTKNLESLYTLTKKDKQLLHLTPLEYELFDLDTRSMPTITQTSEPFEPHEQPQTKGTQDPEKKANKRIKEVKRK